MFEYNKEKSNNNHKDIVKCWAGNPFGAESLSEHAKALELAAKEGNYQYIREHHDEMMTEYGELLEELRAE